MAESGADVAGVSASVDTVAPNTGAGADADERAGAGAGAGAAAPLASDTGADAQVVATDEGNFKSKMTLPADGRDLIGRHGLRLFDEYGWFKGTITNFSPASMAEPEEGEEPEALWSIL